jgi:hypothetical protein
VSDDRNLEALYEIARLLDLPASADSPAVAVVRGVREHIEKLRAVTDGLQWTGPRARMRQAFEVGEALGEVVRAAVVR